MNNLDGSDLGMAGDDGYESGPRAFVGGISWRYSAEDLKEVFLKYGAVGARVMVDKFTNRSRGFGFVTFADESGLIRAIDEVHGTELEGKVVSVKSAVPMTSMAGGDGDLRSDRSYGRRTYEEPPQTIEQDNQEWKAFVGGISWQYNSEQLQDVFRKYSPTDSQVIMDVNGRSRGFGFVTFRNERSLLQAIEEFNNVELDGKRISVTRAVPRDQTLPGTPASALAHSDLGSSRQSYQPRESRHRPYDRVPHHRSYARDLDVGYERAPVIVRTIDRGYDRRGYAYAGPERDPYYRDVAVYEYAEYDRPARYAEPSYSRPGYRGGVERRPYTRPAPYERYSRR